jgi:hypothetical protein
MARVLRATILVAAAAFVACGSATASQLIDREASHIQLSVSASGVATVSYTAHGVRKHVIAWGARDARAPSQGRPQSAFRLDYSGGWGTFHRPVWQDPNVCRPYGGPALAWLVTACTAPDGSFWAVQRWRRLIPIGGSEGTWELHLSHWTGKPASLDIHIDARQGVDVLFGQYTYRGAPVYGFHSTSRGAPLDTYGRNIYVDTYGSAYGVGWHRENGFLAHKPTGIFCYALGPAHGKGAQYRATALGPGVTPIVSWVGRAELGAALKLTGLLADASLLCG